MEILELMRKRHSVREYLPTSIEQEKKDVLLNQIKRLNEEYHTHVQIYFDSDDVFKNVSATYGSFKGCRNLIALVGTDAERCGYVGELICLKAQELGLNTCFVGLTYNRSHVKNSVQTEKGESIQCSIALGYGVSQGKERKSKRYEDVVELKGEKPEHFDEVVEACLLAPTAVNQQKFKVTSNNGEIIIKKSGLGFYMDVDLGILNAHKDLVLGKVNL